MKTNPMKSIVTASVLLDSIFDFDLVQDMGGKLLRETAHCLILFIF